MCGSISNFSTSWILRGSRKGSGRLRTKVAWAGMALTTWLGLMAWALNNSLRACAVSSGGQVAPGSVGSRRSAALTTSNPFHVPRNSITFKAVEPRSTLTTDFIITTSLLHNLINLKYWQQYRQGDEADHRAHQQNHQWLD